MITLFFIAIISIFLYINAPMSYSYEYSFICLILFVVSSVIVLKRNCEKSFIKFEFFFIIAFFFTNYVYSLVYYPINPYFSLFAIPFNEDYITKALALSTVGICFFNLAIYNNNVNPSIEHIHKVGRLKKPRLLLIVLLCAFIPTLFLLAMQGVYSTEFESSLVNAILQYIIYYYLFASFNNISDNPCRVNLIKEIGKLPLILLIIYTLLFLMIGSRTIPMRIAFLVLVLYNFYYKKISKKTVAVLLVLGIFLMAFIGVQRQGYDIGTGSSWDFAAELIINNRSLYVLMEYYDLYGATLGRTLLMNILSVIPFAQSIFLGLTGWSEKDISSGNLVTHLHYKNVVDYERITGLGTNVIGDIYVAYGLIGVIVMMFLFGYILKRINTSLRYNLISILIYSVLFMDVIYMTRASILVSLRNLAWTICVMYICNKGRRILTR